VVSDCTHIPIVAWSIVENVNTAPRWIATVGGAAIVIITIQRLTATALPEGALLTNGTGVTVIAIPRRWFVCAGSGVGTGVRGARVTVIAIHLQAGDTGTVHTTVAEGARVLVIAWTGLDEIRTTGELGA
jgi:hypothetical protein